MCVRGVLEWSACVVCVRCVRVCCACEMRVPGGVGACSTCVVCVYGARACSACVVCLPGCSTYKVCVRVVRAWCAYVVYVRVERAWCAWVVSVRDVRPCCACVRAFNFTPNNSMAYKKQRNYCSRLYKKERKKYYAKLNVKKVMDNKEFWKTVKPFLSDRGNSSSKITLVEGDDIISEDQEVAQ